MSNLVILDKSKQIQDIYSVAGYNNSATEVVDHYGREQRPVQQGRSYLFNGTTNYAVSGTDPSFQTATNQFSLMIDLRFIGTSGGVFNKVRAVGGYESYQFRYTSANTMLLYFDNGSNWVSFNIPVANLSTQMNRIVARWSCTTGTVSDCRAWVNGSEISVTLGTSSGYTSGFNISYINSPLSIGARRSTTGTFSEYGNSEIANLFVWNTALSITDCIRLSDRTRPISQLPNIANLMFGYKCDEGGIVGINTLGAGGATDLTLTNITPATFHQQRTDGYGADWQNQIGFTPSMRFNGGTITSGIGLDNTANSQFLQHTAFTVHCRFVCDVANAGNMLIGNYSTSGAGQFYIYINANAAISIWTNSTEVFLSANNTITSGVEYHLAFIRTGTGANQCSVRLNNVLIGSTFTCAEVGNSTNITRIGQANFAAGQDLVGWLRNIVIVPSAITFTSAPTTWADYQALELTNPSKLAIYNTNITNNPLSIPFTLTNTTNCLIPRNESNINFDAFGGALFFKNKVKYNAQLRQSNCLIGDGTNDHITIPQSVDFDFGSADFTIDVWTRTPNTFQLCLLFGTFNAAGSSGNTFGIEMTAGGVAHWTYTIGGVYYHSSQGNHNPFTLQTNQNYHFCMRRVGNNVEFYVNFVLFGTRAVSGSIATTTNPLTLFAWGASATTAYYNGSLMNFRITKGLALTVNQMKDYSNLSVNTVLFMPIQEGAGDRVFSKVGGHIGALNNFAFPAAWANRQDVVHSNLIQGFEEYTDGGTGLIRVPLSNTNTSLGQTIAGFTSQGIRLGGTFHNSSETLTRQYLAPELIRNDLSNYYFNGATPNSLTYANINSNVNGVNKLTSKNSIANTKRNLRIYKRKN